MSKDLIYIYVIKSYFNTQKGEKEGNIKHFYTNFHVKHDIEVEFITQ